MSIPATSTVLSQSKVQQQASLMLMRTAMDVSKQSGTALIQMMKESMAGLEASVQPHLGRHLDLKI